MYRKDKYSQHSSNIWSVFVYDFFLFFKKNNDLESYFDEEYKDVLKNQS